MRTRFRQLHERGLFVMPNAWDVGSAVRFEALGFPALATTSSGHAASLGREDQQVTLEELCTHVTALVEAVGVPISVDAERLFADSEEEIAATVAALAERGAAGLSIEDYDPRTASIDEARTAVERVGAAAEAAHAHDLVLTARAENHLYGVGDLDDTITRLRAYRAAGADVVYAPGLVRTQDITAVVREVAAPVNVLLLPDGPDPDALAGLGVRRASTGGDLARLAYAAAVAAATDLLPAQRDEAPSP